MPHTIARHAIAAALILAFVAGPWAGRNPAATAPPETPTPEAIPSP